MQYLLCPVCSGKLKKQRRFKPSDHRFGEPEPRTVRIRPFVGARIETVIEKPQGDAEVGYNVYYCEKCKLGWRYKDTVKFEILPAALPKMTVKEFKALNGL